MALTMDCNGLGSLLDAAYADFREMLETSADLFGDAETAVGATQSDKKRYVEFGLCPPRGVPGAMVQMRDALDDIVLRRIEEVQSAFPIGSGRSIRALLDRDNGPILRFSWYPGGQKGPVNHPHSDIDLFTVLPAATEPGLELRSGESWSAASTGPSQILVLPGALLECFGGPPAVEHRVISNGAERLSASFFVNASPLLQIDEDRRVVDVFDARLVKVRGREPSRIQRSSV